MPKNYRISIIGTGNVAWHLGAHLEYAGHTIEEVYGRDLSAAKNLCTRLYYARPVNTLDLTKSKARVFFIMVKDDAIEDVAARLILPDNAILAHTSGTKPLSLLTHSHSGVFYPVQTFTKGRQLNMEEVPVCIETRDQDTESILTDIAKSISRHVYYLDAEKRKVLHLAAVFANNFTNHLLNLSKGILAAEDIDFKTLHALAKETIDKAFAIGPEKAQTGPAVRKDSKVLTEHLRMLDNHQEIKNLYKLLSENILKFS